MSNYYDDERLWHVPWFAYLVPCRDCGSIAWVESVGRGPI